MSAARTPSSTSVANEVADEVADLLQTLKPAELSTCELITMRTALRLALERKQAAERQPVRLDLVRSGQRRRR